MFDLQRLIRPNIRQLTPYSSARDEFSGEAQIFLDANENAWGSPLPKSYNRYPDPLQHRLKAQIAKLKQIPERQIFLGNGSDECIDLTLRAFCEPQQDEVIICPPTYGMYEVCAKIQDAIIKKVPLTADFQLDTESIFRAVSPQTKLIILCSPNNPTGNCLRQEDVERVLHAFNGIVAIDEAYIDFASQPGFLHRLQEFPNLIVWQTFSKAWGLAGLRVGMAFASAAIIGILNKIKYPYNISQLTQETLLQALDRVDQVEQWKAHIIQQRQALSQALQQLDIVQKVYPSEANFVLAKIRQARKVYAYLLQQGIVVRDRSQVALCEDCLRITVGRPEENEKLLAGLQAYQAQQTASGPLSH
ncbi:histidinol-phosphate transaminase [Thermoflavifilum thermophilum]|uniref:Histidinol-phosphate aminotransferase n=1 Tax=Thermoflavifilum thermophilum TaxID=1393122 RepID=A0A1I7NH68_9BACT|nr:histidinol-phosphate transaminase [Thermoflavifilum thermophilum]SFV33983.1 histidinol-phosphate aminotransferase [Thermoflavifilum thermophilum]